jgi:ATP-binding cassette subfamily B protein
MLFEFFLMLVSTRRMQELRKENPMLGNETTVLTDFNVELKNVSFGYNKEDVIKNISVTIPQNSVTAFVGPSGSGKTTASRLIARFWDVREGEILIGGKNIRDIDPERLMSYMSFVFQDVTLFNDTVMNNIRIGKHNATDEEVYAAAKMARCDEFIMEMPERYNTVIGENGSTLSGGERQRISIARALLKNAPIVLLDEATASLDPENETQIQEAISALVKGRTVIVIAHRLRTVIGADKIAVLENGKLIEHGTGEQLLAANGLFARLYKIQQESMGWTVGQ